MNKKLLTIPATAVALAIALAGCASSGSGSSSTGMDHSMHDSASASASASGNSADHNMADTMFAQMMIPHHSQAVIMSDIMLAKQGLPAPATDLAKRIKAAQGPEIETMTGWLKSWNEPTASSSHSSHSMAGMLGDDELAKLKAAQGAEAAKLFMSQMIAHHEGAITMAKTQQSDGKNAAAIALAKDIIKAQEAEIEEMKKLLTTL